MTDRRNRRDWVIAVIGASAVCVFMAILLAGHASAQTASPQQIATASVSSPAPVGIPARPGTATRAAA